MLPVAATVSSRPCAVTSESDQSEIRPSDLLGLARRSKYRATASRMDLGAETPCGSSPALKHPSSRRESTPLMIFSTKAATASLCWLPIVEKLFSSSLIGRQAPKSSQ